MQFIITRVGRQRPVVIQSLFPMFQSVPPPRPELDAYLDRLLELKHHGVQISMVQIYSAHRPTAHLECGHLPLRLLSQIAREVREKTGLRAEVFQPCGPPDRTLAALRRKTSARNLDVHANRSAYKAFTYIA